ncbi:MAG: alpha/beta fold hydrolase [Chloroflexi bacterium]|nr:alpha/beta fold hydrolase [Chloroflexota bacterium]
MTPEAAAKKVVSDMQTVSSADGTQIAYWHSGDGPPLVLVHGGISDRSAWILVQPLLAERFTVYTMNRRGREGSGEPEAHALEREFEDIVAVVDAIGEPVHLLGHSGGALCSMGAALLTDRLLSLILYEPPSPDAVHAALTASSIRELIQVGKNEEAALEFFRKGPQVPEEDIERLRRSPIWPRIVALAPTLVPEIDALIGYEFDLSAYSAIDIPLLLLLGSDSPPGLREVSEVLADIVPNARTVELEGQQHGANFDAPELFAAEVTKFLEEI